MNYEIFDVCPGVQASMEEVHQTTQVFDSLTSQRVTTRAVPGTKDERYVPWGADDLLPYDIARLIGSDEVTASNALFNVLTCYGAGIKLNDTRTGKPTQDHEIRKWERRQMLPNLFLELVTDMKYYYFGVVVVILSRDGKRVTRAIHKEACHCRFAPADKYGRIRHIYYADWEYGTPRPEEIEKIQLLDPADPISDLMQRMGREPDNNGRVKRKGDITATRKFAILVKYPTIGSRYYPIPYYSSIFRGGSFDEKRMISAGKRAKLKHHASIKYHIEIEANYFNRVLSDLSITDPQERVKYIDKVKAQIRDFVTSTENAGKTFFSSYYIDPAGKEVHDIIVKNLEAGTKEGGDWADDINVASNTLCYAFNTHPNLIGATPGKSSNNNSGSDKRELFTMKQAVETSFHDILLLPFRLICEYNGWDVEPSVGMILLTTLDEHTDAKTIDQPVNQLEDDDDN